MQVEGLPTFCSEYKMKSITLSVAFLAANTVAWVIAAEEVPVSLEEIPEDTDAAASSAASPMEAKIAKRSAIHRNLALGTYVGFLVSDVSGIATAAMIHTDRTSSSAYDVLRYGHWALVFLSILAYIPQSVIAWRMMTMKKRIGLPINRKHRVTSLLTSIGVAVEIAGIATLAALGASNSAHFKTISAVHCATSTLLVIVPFTISLVNSRPRT
jgi:hypothetical protein